MVWNCLVEDTALFLRHFLEKLTNKSKQVTTARLGSHFQINFMELIGIFVCASPKIGAEFPALAQPDGPLSSKLSFRANNGQSVNCSILRIS